MIAPPNDPNTLRVIGIDPGTNTLGIALLSVNPETQHLSLLDAGTFHTPVLMRNYTQFLSIHGERQTKLFALEQSLIHYFQSTQPHCVASESPYMGRFPQAFAALTECLFVIRKALYQYDPYLALQTYDPATIKTGLGVSGKSGDKTLVRNGLYQLPWTQPHRDYMNGLDEHAIDAIAVAYRHTQTLLP